MSRTLSTVAGILAIASNALIATALAQAPAQSSTQSSTDPLTAKVDAVFAPGSRPGAPGCVCSVIRDGKVLYANSHGLADLERNVPITTESVFYIGSTSKQFTAASIALLVSEGKLSLSADVRTLIPELKDIGAAVTVEQLVHHTSGVRDYGGLLGLRGWRDPDRLNNEIIIALLAKQRSLNFPPGSQFLYSNSNYVLLAEIVKRVSGKPLPQFAKERLFDPLGMKDTQFESDSSSIVRNRVLSYGRRNGQSGGAYSQYHKTTEAYGAGSLLTTVGDLARWDENFYTGKVGGTPLLDMFQVKGVLSTGTPTNYGFGLMYGEYRGLPIVEHGGAYQGYRAQFTRFPKQRFSVMVLCNLEVIDTDVMVRRVADIYLEKELAPISAPVVPTPAEATIDPNLLDGYVGKFALDANPQIVFTFTRDGDNFYAQLTGQRRLQIYPSSETEFFYKVVNAQITFHREPDGTTNRITLHQNGDRGASRVEDFVLSSADLQQYIGKFYSDELDVTFEIVLKDAGLEARVKGAPAAALRPNRRDVFSNGTAIINFRRNAQGQIEALSFGGGRALNMIFAKQP
jgi:CubicO group peptidase (beta-lactamase class C family)